MNKEQNKNGHALWLKTLERLRLENLSLKNILIEILKKDISGEHLQKAEYFQGLFLNMEAVINLLRRDIVNHTARLTSDLAQPVSESGEERKLQNDIASMEQQFAAMKKAFESFVAGILNINPKG